MLNKNFNKIFLFVLVILDAIAITVSYLLSYYIRFGSTPPSDIPSIQAYLNAIIFICIIWVIVFKFLGLYEHKRISFIDEFYSLFIAISFGTIINFAITFLYREFSYSRLVAILAFFFNIVFIAFFRFSARRMRLYLYKKGIGRQKVLIVGLEGSDKIIGKIKSEEDIGYEIVGLLDDEKEGEIKGIKILGKTKDILRVVKEQKVSEIIIPLSSSTQKEVLNVILELEDENVKINIVPDLLGIITSRVNVEDLSGIPLMTLKGIPLSGINRVVKRIFDLFLSIIFLIIFSPIILILILLIKYSRWSSPGPAIYTQERIGLDGKEFICYKFRTMILDAEKDTGPVWAKKGDKRVTKLGAFLRKTSLDELPQLINIIKGDMSLIGPRPERPFFVSQFKNEISRYMRRHKVKSGITGWAQVNGLRGDTDIYERTKYDLYYVENWSIIFDIKILIRTIFEIFFHKNAY